MIIGRDLISSLGIDIHVSAMAINWNDGAISWRYIDSTTNNVFALSQYNALFDSKTKRIKRHFIGMINFYRDMWQKSSDLLTSLTALTSKNFK